MTRKKFSAYIIIAFFIFSLTTILIDRLSQDKTSQTQLEFNKFTDSVFLSELSSSAFNLHFYLKNPTVYGIDSAPDVIGTINYDDMKNCESYYLDMINTLKSFDYDELTLEGKQTYDIFMYYLTTELAFPDVCANYEPLSPTVGIQAQLPVLLSQYAFYDEADVTTYLKLLHNLPTYFAELLDFETTKSELGFFMSVQTADDIITQCLDFANSDNNFLLETFDNRIDALSQLNKEQKKKYKDQNKELILSRVVPAYHALANGISSLKNTSKNQLGLCYYEDGKNYYQYLVTSYTGSNRSISELETMIETRLKSDSTILASLTKDTKVYSSMLKYSISNDNHSPEKLLKELIVHTETIFPTIACKDFAINYVPEALEAHLSPAFYLSPPIDDPHNNQIYINNCEEYADIDLFATLAHEGYPGHLYQTTYFNSKNPALIRNLLNFGGYTEGWATYVELYSYGFREDNPEVVKALQSSASYSLALYCLADIGINYHGWTFDETCTFFESNGIDDQNIVKEIFNTMIAEPANYLQYYVGYLEILDLKTKMKSLLGDSYTDLAFHTYILDMGPAPFSVLEKYMGYSFYKKGFRLRNPPPAAGRFIDIFPLRRSAIPMLST